MRARPVSRPALGLAALLVLAGCRSGPSEGWSSRARTMILTSGPTAIVMSSSQVPGYWAREAESEQEFFLYTPVRSYEKGGRVTVEGPFGVASAAVFRDEEGTYLRRSPTRVLVVWKMAGADGRSDKGPASREAAGHARRP